VDFAERYNLQYIDPKSDAVTKVEPEDGLVTTALVSGLTPETDVCFRLTVTRGGLTGPPSTKVCTKTAVAPPTASPTPTPSATPTPSTTPSASATPTPSGTFSPGDPNTDPVMKQHWIAVSALLPKDEHVEAEARSDVKKLSNANLPGKYLDSRFYTRLLIVGPTPPPALLPSESYLVFLGPFDTQADAESQCPAITDATGDSFCEAAQPDPPQ
jgi:hypothetical protein